MRPFKNALSARAARKIPFIPERQNDVDDMVRRLGMPSSESPHFIESLPFSINDVTAGCENELQAVVMGDRQSVDLPIAISRSSFFQSLAKRAEAGDTGEHIIAALNDYLCETSEAVWENSWIRFPKHTMSRYTNSVFDRDLLADKQCPQGPKRSDAHVFAFRENGEDCVRVPVSYFLKLALAESIAGEQTHPLIRYVGKQCMDHFLNDNTSPETFSFHPVPFDDRFRMGCGLARETLKRFLLCQALAMYGNAKFQLRNCGQKALVYFSPHPPVRQKRLNDVLSDAFYRELFMSPCLSGWNRGETKYRYMHLCHEILSRSRLNAIGKLKEANIITRNLVVLPNTSNISLANNGTHISIGSRRLSALLEDGKNGFGPRQEKMLGDLVIKIVEHFLPLSVGTHSAAPYRLDFWDFHPEKALGFLPHELDFTHLRMIWRRWKKKAHLKFFGHPITPFGPEWLDRFVSRLLRLKGDFLLDFRLIDYPVALLSTELHPSLDGSLENDERLKTDLAHMGVFHSRMSLYLLFKLRQYSAMGFSGFEGRHYSVFENLGEDMAEATNLQVLLTALAYKYALTGMVTHADIPDTPSVESERRQVFFGTAIGIPTFFVRKNTGNRFLAGLLRRTKKTRMSRRYPGYVRVRNADYQKALLQVITEDGRDLVDLLGLQSTVRDLARRVENPQEYAAAGKLTKGILEEAGATSPMKLTGDEFNSMAEQYYRETLRRRHIVEACNVLVEDCKEIDQNVSWEGLPGKALRDLLQGGNVPEFLVRGFRDLDGLEKDTDALEKIIHLLLLTICRDMEKAQCRPGGKHHHGSQDSPSIH